MQKNWGRIPLPVSGWIYFRLAELLYEGNQLSEAWDHLDKGLERAELGGDVRALIAGYLTGGRLKLAEVDIDSAADYLDRARPYVESAQFPDWDSRYERFQLAVWLAQGRLRAAVDWSDQMLQKDALDERPEREDALLSIAQVLFVKGDGDSLDQALALLRLLIQSAQDEGRMGVQIEALALQALSYWQRGDRA